MNVVSRTRMLRERRNQGGRVGRVLLITFLTVSALGAFAMAIALGAAFLVYQHYAQGYVPIEAKLQATDIGLTQIYDRNGPCTPAFNGCVLLGSLSDPHGQIIDPVPLSQISNWLVLAEISTEDNSFYSNPGFDPKGLLRAVWDNYVVGGFGTGPGGSSITEQLAENLYICPSVGVQPPECRGGAPKTLSRKLREFAYGIELWSHYSKDQILQWYLNQIPYGGQYVGVEAAAEGYFHENASQLDLAQSALLAGIPQAPTAYNPLLNCVENAKGDCVVNALGQVTVGGAAIQRQHEVLDLMVKHNRITKAQETAAEKETLAVYPLTNNIKASSFIDDQVEPRLVRMCQAGVLPKLPGIDCEQTVHSAGWQVTTTLDYAQTEQAQQLVQQQIAAGQADGCACHDASVVTIDPTTGQMLVYVSSADPSNVSDPEVSGNIDEAVEINQPGSSFKPVVYTAWFNDLNRAPESILWDTSPMTVDGVTVVDPGVNGGHAGLISARAALGGSQNVPAFRAAQEVGIQNVIDMAKKMGITTLQQGFDPTFRDHQAVYYGPSIATGGANITVVDMAYMMSVIANMGVMVGVPTYAQTMNMADLQGTATCKTQAQCTQAANEKTAFERGDNRLPGTRNLDPVVILKVVDGNGKVLYDHATANDLKREQVVNAGSVWLTHSIISDCKSRYIIWTCGSSNNDNDLDAFMPDGTKIPMGAKTGTQQGPLSSNDTLATWMNTYTRYSATAVWLGNADKELVGNRYFQSEDLVDRIAKNWTSEYLADLQKAGEFKEPADFSSLQPANVAYGPFNTPTTAEGHAGGCNQEVTGWYRTDVTYASQCQTVTIDSRNGLLAGPNTPPAFREDRQFVKLPSFDTAQAIELAHAFGIPIAPTAVSTGQPAVQIANLATGQTITQSLDVIGSVQTAANNGWKLEIGTGITPSAWIQIGSGNSNTSGVLGHIDVTGAPPGIYTVRLTAATGESVEVSINIEPQPQAPGNGNGNGPPGATPTVQPGQPSQSSGQARGRGR